MSSVTDPGAVEPVAQTFAKWAVDLDSRQFPPELRQTLRRMVLDATGLMVSARNEPYVQAVLAAADGIGDSTAIGHTVTLTASDAAMLCGTAVHGEDFDDTFEGTPVHVGSVMVPAVLAVAEQENASGETILKALAVGAELMCRMAVVAPTAIHRAGFHPTAVIGAMGAAAGISALLGLNVKQTASALGIAGSMASGIIEYLAEGTSTKRLHPGWAASAGIRAARLSRAGFDGPRTVLDGIHGFFFAFADASIERDMSHLSKNLGSHWYAQRLAFKPYACGTMVQPFIDCGVMARKQGIQADNVQRIIAHVGEGTVHRLWEPELEKRTPTTAYSAKFSGAFGIALGLADGKAGLDQFTEKSVSRSDLLALTSKTDYVINPDDPYPENYTGTLEITLKDGSTHNVHQLCLRGGFQQPLDDDELDAKFMANVQFGGWTIDSAQVLKSFVDTLFDSASIRTLSQFRR